MAMVILCGVILFMTSILCGATFYVKSTKFWKIWSIGNVVVSFANFIFVLDKL